MRAATLIALNFLREQRWVLLILGAWVVGSSAIAGASNPIAVDDVLFFLKQQATYGIAFTLFLAASGLQNERKSRRILAVLSKGITRREYLGGIMLGVVSASLLYCMAMAAAGAVVFRATRLPQPGAWIVVVMIFANAAFVGAVSLLFSTLVPPLFAALFTAMTVGVLMAVAHLVPEIVVALPIYAMTQRIAEFGLRSRLSWSTSAPLIVVCLVESVMGWLLAAALFESRDVTVPME